MDWVRFELLLLLIQNLLEDKIEHNELAALVGSNHPTRSIFINLVNYGIISSSFLTSVGQKVVILDAVE